MFWALGEVLRAECGIVETDSSEQAWEKLRDYVGDLMGKTSQHSDREAALIGRLLGVEVPPDLAPMRTTRSACARRSSRRCGAASRRSPSGGPS